MFQLVLLNFFQYNGYSLIVDYFFTSMLRKFCTFWRFLHPKIRSIYRNILLILTNVVYYLWGLDVCFKTETDSDLENEPVVTEGEGGRGRGGVGVWGGRVHTAAPKPENKGLLCSSGNSAQSSSKR